MLKAARPQGLSKAVKDGFFRLSFGRIKAGDRPQVRYKHPCLDSNGNIKPGSPCAKQKVEPTSKP